MSLPWLSFGWPLALWALLLCLALPLSLHRSRAVLSRRILVLVTLARVLAVALVILALADARVSWRTDDLAIAAVVDRSPSVSPSEAAAVSHQIKGVAARDDDVAWVDLTAPATPGGPDLAGQITEAAALLPAGRARRVLVATDGREPSHRVQPVVEELASAGVSVWLLPIGSGPPIDQLAVSGVELPRLVRADESVTVEVNLFSLQAQRVTLKLSIGGLLASETALDVPEGRSTHRQPIIFPEEGVRRLEVEVVPERDTLAENNAWTSLVQVVPRARVLLVRENPLAPPPLATVLEENRLEVDVVGPDQVPADAGQFDRYHLVIVDEVDPARLGDPQQRAVRTWVEGGGSLITVTGANAVRSEPAHFREIEPIMPPRAIPESPPLELILVIDRSSSMSGHPMDMARRAGVAAVRALRADSRVGVVAFSGMADQVIAPVDMSHRDWVIGFISSIGSGGGTDIAAALAAAQGIITPDPSYTHHVILLSDGISSHGPAVSQAHALAWQRVSISTISLGHGNRLMREIAQIGGGRHHVAHNPSQLPQLFVREAQLRQPPPFREEETRPQVVAPMDFLDGVDFAADPPLGGYVLAEARPGAEVVLASPDGDPVLAHWYSETGRVMSFTSATGDSWADQWRSSPGFRRLWSQMAWDMLRQRDSNELGLRLDRHPTEEGLRIVTATLPDPESDTPPEVRLARRADDPKDVILVRRGPGLWQGEVALNEGFIVWGTPPGGAEPTAAVAEDNPYAPDLRAFGPDAAALGTLAELGGGRVVREIDEVLVPAERVPTMLPLRLPLLLIALVIYLLSIMLQRLPQNVRSKVTGARRDKDTEAPRSAAKASPKRDRAAA